MSDVENKVETTEKPVESLAKGPERLSDEDMLTIERANNKRQIAVANAKAATAEAEAAEMGYKNLVMQLFLKYGLSQEDAINPDGTVKRGGVAANGG